MSDFSSTQPHLIRPESVLGIEHTPGGLLRVLHGDELGLGEVSLLLSNNPPGGGPREHWHDYIEIFVLHEGAGTYVIGNESFEAEAGDIVVVPSGIPHSFRCTGDGPLTHTAIHQAAHSVTRVAS